VVVGVTVVAALWDVISPSNSYNSAESELSPQAAASRTSAMAATSVLIP